MEIKTNGFEMPNGDIHTFIPPSPTETERGGIKAKTRTTETLEIAVDPTTGKAYAPNLAPDTAYVTDVDGNKYKLSIENGQIIWNQVYEEVPRDYILDIDLRNLEVTNESKQIYHDKYANVDLALHNATIQGASKDGIVNAQIECINSIPVDFSEGYTIEYAYRGKATAQPFKSAVILNRTLYERHPDNGLQFSFGFPYYTNNGIGFKSLNFAKSFEDGTKILDVINEETDILYVVISVSKTGESSYYMNGRLVKALSKPEDFVEHIDNLTKDKYKPSTPYYFRVNGKCSDTSLLSYCKITKGTMTAKQVETNYIARYGKREISKLSLAPKNIQLYPYSKMPLHHTVEPPKVEYALEMTSDNNVVANFEKGNIVAKNVGRANIVAKAKNTNISDTVAVEVVDKLKNVNLVSKRTTPIERVAIVDPPKSLYVGDNRVLSAYALPYEPMNDNLIVFTSDNPNVCSVEFGVLTGNSVGIATITATALNTSISTTFQVKVERKIEEVFTLSNTYYVPLPMVTTNGFLDPNNDHATETTKAIIDLLKYASDNKYRRIVFPKGEYLVTPEISETRYTNSKATFFLPDNLVVDFNNSIINVKPTEIAKTTGYKLFMLDGNIKNTILCNVDIRGDRFTNTTEALNEQCCNVVVAGAINCGLVNCRIGDSGGFNVNTSRRAINNVSDSVGLNDTNVEIGTFDDSGNKITATNTWRTINKIDISKLHGYFELGTVWGYAGYTMKSRLYDMWIYDSNNKLLEVKRDCRVFTRYDLPQGFKYADVVIYQDVKPKNNIDPGGFARFYSLYEPYHCYMKDCTFHDSYSTGMACCGGKYWTYDNLTFINNGRRDPSCHVDYEDGWESAIGDVWKNCKFDNKGGGGIILVSGDSVAFFNNDFQCKLDPRNRSSNWRFFHNIITSNVVGNCQSESVIAQNILLNGATIKDGQHYHDPDTQYETRIIDNYSV